MESAEDERGRYSAGYWLGYVHEEDTPGQRKNDLEGLEVLNWVLGIQIAVGIVSVPISQPGKSQDSCGGGRIRVLSQPWGIISPKLSTTPHPPKIS